MFALILVLLSTTSVLGSDFACNFVNDKCGWLLGGGPTCRWEQKTGNISLVGAPACSAVLAWSFGSRHIGDANYMSIEYSMTGPGPVSLSIANDEDGLNWSCVSVSAGSEYRMAHVQLNNKTKYIYIKANVAAGSELLITQIWNSLLGAKPQTRCPPHVFDATVTTTPMTVTNSFNKTEAMANTDNDVIFEQTSTQPEIAMNTTMPYFNITTAGFLNETNAIMVTPMREPVNDRDEQLLSVLKRILSGRSHTVTVTGNFSMKFQFNILPKQNDNK